MSMTIDDIGKMIADESNRTAARFDQMDIRFNQIDARFEQMNTRFEHMDTRFEQMDTRLEQMNTRFDRLEKRMMNVEELGEDARGRLISIDDRLSKVEYTLEEANPRQLKKSYRG